uniref:Uncharacterized protein n=1 Tax=Cacopsylla melanoneura TaxID=428564 RepID=A0A8D8WM61_9HEMI
MRHSTLTADSAPGSARATTGAPLTSDGRRCTTTTRSNSSTPFFRTTRPSNLSSWDKRPHYGPNKRTGSHWTGACGRARPLWERDSGPTQPRGGGMQNTGSFIRGRDWLS